MKLSFFEKLMNFSEPVETSFASAFQKAFGYNHKPNPMANYKPFDNSYQFKDLQEQDSPKDNDWRSEVSPEMVDWIILVTECRLRHDHNIVENRIQSVKRKLEEGKIVEVTMEELRFKDQPPRTITLPMGIVPECFPNFMGIVLESTTPVENLPPIPSVATV